MKHLLPLFTLAVLAVGCSKPAADETATSTPSDAAGGTAPAKGSAAKAPGAFSATSTPSNLGTK